jgi:hypothetical protein
MQGNDLDNRPTHRYWVLADSVLIKDEHDETSKRGWFKTMFSHRVVYTPDAAALSSLWRFSQSTGARLELVFVGDLAKDATYLWDSIDKHAANPFNDWHVFESIDKVVQQVPYRPDILGYIDMPSRSAYYGGKGLTLLELH